MRMEIRSGLMQPVLRVQHCHLRLPRPPEDFWAHGCISLQLNCGDRSNLTSKNTTTLSFKRWFCAYFCWLCFVGFSSICRFQWQHGGSDAQLRHNALLFIEKFLSESWSSTETEKLQFLIHHFADLPQLWRHQPLPSYQAHLAQSQRGNEVVE